MAFTEHTITGNLLDAAGLVGALGGRVEATPLTSTGALTDGSTARLGRVVKDVPPGGALTMKLAEGPWQIVVTTLAQTLGRPAFQPVPCQVDITENSTWGALIADATTIGEVTPVVLTEVKGYRDAAVDAASDAEAALGAVPAAVTAAAPAAVNDAIYDYRTTKNLYNPADPDVLTDKVPAATKGNYTTLANYKVSGFIPVTAGQAYSFGQVRYYEWYDASRVSLAVATNTGSNASTQQGVTAPATASFLRVTNNYPTYPNVQVEAGSSATAYEAWFAGTRQSVDPQFANAVAVGINALPGAPLTVTKSGNDVTLTRDLAGKALAQRMNTAGSPNGGFGLVSTTLAGTTIHDTSDDITPIRTQMGTVGADHGYACVATFTNPDAKTAADVGSTWTDGTRTYVLFAIDSTGKLVMGGSYATDSSGLVTSATVAPSANLTHVSGATKTGTIDRTTATVSQLRPGGQYRPVVSMWLDNTPVTADATRTGRVFVVRETYDVPDYASLYDLCRANVGTAITALPVATAVKVTNTWTWTVAGCVVDTELVEVAPTSLSQCGSLQSAIMAKTGSTITRYMPGVGTVNGFDFTAGADMSSWSATQTITTGNLTRAGRPASIMLDTLITSGAVEVGFVFGYLPAGRRGDEASRDAARIANTPTYLWNIRNTKKSYPNWVNSAAPGWGVLRTTGYRAYLSPAQVATVLAGKGDALTASAAAATVLNLT